MTKYKQPLQQIYYLRPDTEVVIAVLEVCKAEEGVISDFELMMLIGDEEEHPKVVGSGTVILSCFVDLCPLKFPLRRERPALTESASLCCRGPGLLLGAREASRDNAPADCDHRE